MLYRADDEPQLAKSPQALLFAVLKPPMPPLDMTNGNFGSADRPLVGSPFSFLALNLPSAAFFSGGQYFASLGSLNAGSLVNHVVTKNRIFVSYGGNSANAAYRFDTFNLG